MKKKRKTTSEKNDCWMCDKQIWFSPIGSQEKSVSISSFEEKIGTHTIMLMPHAVIFNLNHAIP